METATEQFSDVESLRRERKERALRTYRQMLRGENVGVVEQDIALSALEISIEQYHADRAEMRKISELESKIADNESRQAAAEEVLAKANARLKELEPVAIEFGNLQNFVQAQTDAFCSMQTTCGTMKGELAGRRASAQRFMEGD
jgi:hypothetical protein